MKDIDTTSEEKMEAEKKRGRHDKFATRQDEEILKEATATPLPVAAGHKDSLRVVEGRPDLVYKTYNANEHLALEALMHTRLRYFVPEIWGKHIINGEEALVMQNLLFCARHPHVMDVKIGSRTFQETEVKNEKRRTDLLKKMMETDPNEASEEEKKDGITKLRYMQFRERLSSSASFGFRIEAVSIPKEIGASISKEESKNINNQSQIMGGFAHFLDGQRQVWKKFLKRLMLLRRELQKSQWFSHHEIVGSSLLFVYENDFAHHLDRPHRSCLSGGGGVQGNRPPQVGVWMIDFANTSMSDTPLDHRKPWQAGNHEEGYLTGLDNLISTWEKMEPKYFRRGLQRAQSQSDIRPTSA